MESSVGKWTGSDTVVDGGPVAAEPPVFPHIGSKEVARGRVLGFVPPWDRARVVAFFFQNRFVGVELEAVPGKELRLTCFK